MQRALVVRILREMADAIEKQDNDVLNRLILALKLDSDSRKTKTPRKATPVRSRLSQSNPMLLALLLRDLQEAPNRDAGSEILERSKLNRQELTDLARLTNVHVSKDNDVPKIKEKLIESIIGSRLNSRAIRGD
jgi:hypothetical protein